MNELINTKPDINVKEAEYKRLLGYPANYELEGRPRELAEWARQWYNENGRPWVYAVHSDELNISNGKLLINNVEFSSKKLLKQLNDTDSHSAMLVAVSAGKECEEKAHQLWMEEKPDEYFFLEIYGSAVVELLITNTGFSFCEWGEKNGFAILPHYSPGYPGWKIEDQSSLLKLIKEKKNIELPGEIEVLQTGMLKPKKSMLALFGFTKQLDKVRNLRELIPCQTCSLQPCQYRRIPFKHPRKQIEDIQSLQPFNKEKEKKKFSLTRNAKYSANLKALQKWSKEKLQFNILDDSSVEAKFSYEGSTCSNMGHSLLFDYHIKLSSQDEGYKINFLNCNPADEGYTYMCEYIREPESFINQIKNEKPLLGNSLDDILKWQRQFSPEGCYCKVESRKHKWGLAFEVLHYALIQNEINNLNS